MSVGDWAKMEEECLERYWCAFMLWLQEAVLAVVIDVFWNITHVLWAATLPLVSTAYLEPAFSVWLIAHPTTPAHSETTEDRKGKGVLPVWPFNQGVLVMPQRKGHRGMGSGASWGCIVKLCLLFKFSLAECGVLIIHLRETFWWVKFDGESCQCRTLQSCWVYWKTTEKLPGFCKLNRVVPVQNTPVCTLLYLSGCSFSESQW